MTDVSVGLDDVCAPLQTLSEQDGYIVLAGVGFEKMTLLHLAEKNAGRKLFRLSPLILRPVSLVYLGVNRPTVRHGPICMWHVVQA